MYPVVCYQAGVRCAAVLILIILLKYRSVKTQQNMQLCKVCCDLTERYISEYYNTTG
jgi:hypothetical protein